MAKITLPCGDFRKFTNQGVNPRWRRCCRWGSALYAAAFLEQFVDDRPWAHLDIAGPAYNNGGAWGHVPSGGTGFSVPTIVELVQRRARG